MLGAPSYNSKDPDSDPHLYGTKPNFCKLCNILFYAAHTIK